MEQVSAEALCVNGSVRTEDLLKAYQAMEKKKKYNAEYMKKYRQEHREEWNKKQRERYAMKKSNVDQKLSH